MLLLVLVPRYRFAHICARDFGVAVPSNKAWEAFIMRIGAIELEWGTSVY